MLFDLIELDCTYFYNEAKTIQDLPKIYSLDGYSETRFKFQLIRSIYSAQWINFNDVWQRKINGKK